MGPMTGRGAGYCAGNGAATDTGPMGYRRYGRGFGRGAGMQGGGGAFGGGRARRRWFSALPWSRRFGFGGGMAAYPEPDPELAKQALKRDAEALQSELEMIQKRLAQMEEDTTAQ